MMDFGDAAEHKESHANPRLGGRFTNAGIIALFSYGGKCFHDADRDENIKKLAK
jgi:hypothetical protein